jgi:ABC-2 type transport system ATP-binding protein
MDNILEVQGLVKKYPKFTLDHVSFSLPEGCVTGFIGANGAGKTTTIKSILGLTQ